MVCIWLAALIVLVADPVLRQEVDSEGQQYFSQDSNQKRTISKAGFEIALNSGPFLGLVIMDVLNM
jgi:hypothetical protein